MTRMNRKLEYALMALKHMSFKRPGQLTSAKEVVSVIGVPFDATARVLQLMAQKGLLRVEQGAHGGYAIIKDLEKVSLFDLHEIVLGPLDIVKCAQGQPDCDLIGQCNIQAPLVNLNRRLNEFYRSVSLAELLKIKESTRPSYEPQMQVDAR